MAIEVQRYLLQEYYGIPGETTVYHYINSGFTKLDEAGGATVDTVAYIGDKNSTTSITGYENNFSYESRYHEGNAVCDDLYEIATKQKVGSDCVRTLVSINLSKKRDDSPTSYEARCFNVVVQANPPVGGAKSNVTMSGTIHQNGDLVLGTFDTATKTFTADQ